VLFTHELKWKCVISQTKASSSKYVDQWEYYDTEKRLSRISLLLPLMPQTPQFVFTITLGSKSATSHFSLPNVFGPGVTTHSNSPATSDAVDNDRTSLSISAGEKPVTNIGHLLARSIGRTGPHSVGEAICRTGSKSSDVDVGEGNPKPGEKKEKTGRYTVRGCAETEHGLQHNVLACP